MMSAIKKRETINVWTKEKHIEAINSVFLKALKLKK